MLTIRKLQASDAEIFLAVRLAALKECPTAFGSSYEEEVSQTVEQTAERLAPAADGSNCVLGAFDESKLVGTIAFQRGAKRKQRHGAFVFAAYVVPGWRQKGIGQALVAALIEEARLQPGMRFLQLTVTADNRAAIRLYENAGFKTIGVLPGGLCVDDKYYDDVIMLLQLES